MAEIGTSDLAEVCGVSTQTIKGWLHRNEIVGLECPSDLGSGRHRKFSTRDAFLIILFSDLAKIGACGFAKSCLEGFEVPPRSEQVVIVGNAGLVTMTIKPKDIWQKVDGLVYAFS